MSNKNYINNLHLKLAGPGAGKTYDMVKAVKDKLPDLKPNRFLCVITYTNAATEEIRSRLEKQISIRPNVFVGTIHSFFIRFIFEPFAELLGISTGKVFYADEIFCPAFFHIKDKNEKYKSIAEKITRENSTSSKLNTLLNKALTKAWKEDKAEEYIKFSKGENKRLKFVHDKVLEKSLEILQDENIANIIANKLQFVFVDEYQDARLYQHQAFEKIWKQNKTKFYFVGDPLQSIYHFTYSVTHNRNEKAPNSFNDIPIMQLKSTVNNKKELKNNWRSDKLIREFVNNFQLDDFSQIYPKNKKVIEESGTVLFINKNKVADIIDIFLSKIIEFGISKENNIRHKLILTRYNETISNIDNNNNIKLKAIDDSSNSNNIIQWQELIFNILNTNTFELIKKYKFGKVAQRKCTLKTITKLINLLKKEKDDAIESLKGWVSFNSRYKNTYQGWNKKSEKLQIIIQEIWENETYGKFERKPETTEQVRSLENLLFVTDTVTDKEDIVFYSSIHKAKGLEATCVLVIAEEPFGEYSNIINWLEKDKTTYKAENEDEHRVGYVAFSRARKLLCIASLEKRNDLITKMNNFNIMIEK